MVEYQKSAGLIVYYKDSEDKNIRFLLLKYPSYWGFVKGIIEGDENEEKTALRELEEEAGIKAEIIKGFKEKQEWFFKLKGKLIRKQAIFFLAKTTKEQADKVKISFEHEDFVWLNYEEALKKMKIKQNKEMLRKSYELIEKYERASSSEKTKNKNQQMNL